MSLLNRRTRCLAVAAIATSLLTAGCATTPSARALVWEQLMAPPAGYAAALAVRADLVTIVHAEARYRRGHGSYAAAATLFDPHRTWAHLTAGTRLRLATDPSGFCAEATGETSTAMLVATASQPSPKPGSCPSGGMWYAAPDDEPGPVPQQVAALSERDYLALVLGIRTVLVAAALGHPGSVPSRRDQDAVVDAAGVTTAVTATGCVALTSTARPGLVFYSRPRDATRAIARDHRDVAGLLRGALRVGSRRDRGACGSASLAVDPPMARAMVALDRLTPLGSPLPATRIPSPSTNDQS